MLLRKYEIINHFPNKTTHNIVKDKKKNQSKRLVNFFKPNQAYVLGSRKQYMLHVHDTNFNYMFIESKMEKLQYYHVLYPVTNI